MLCPAPPWVKHVFDVNNERQTLLVDVTASGLTEGVWQSERWMNEMIVQASHLLATLGVERETVARIVEESVQQITTEA